MKHKNVEPIKCKCCPHIETSQLVCCENQLTGFYMRAALAFNGLRKVSKNFQITNALSNVNKIGPSSKNEYSRSL